MSETALFFGLATQRLKERCRWAGLTLLLAVLVPYEVIDNKPQFLWQLISELSVAGALAALAPVLAGATILAAAARARRGTSLAIAVLASLATASILIRLGEGAAAWDVLPLPQSLAEHPSLALLGLALTAAGANLAWKPHCRRASRATLAAGALLVALYYIAPASGGDAPILAAGRLARMILDGPFFRLKLGFAFLTAIALAPAGIALAGLAYVRAPPAREQPLLGVFAVYGPPALLLTLVYRSFFGAAVGAEILASIGAAFLLAAVLAIIAASVEVLGEAAVTPEAELEPPAGLPMRRALAIAAAASISACAAQAALARPPAKGVEWALRPATAEGDRLFGELVPAWNSARIRWEQVARPDERARPKDKLKARAPAAVEGEAAAAEAAELEVAARAMVDAAGSLDAGLGVALGELAREALDLHAAGRRFYRLVHEVNEASRRAGLPYYLDPTISIAQTGDGLVRRFRALSFRIERIRSFAAGSSRFATLDVRSMGLRRTSHQRLGFSRDMQPFALVVLDETEPFGASLAAAASAAPPTCGRSADAAAQRGLDRCGEVLAALRLSLSAQVETGIGASIDAGAFNPGLVAMTERHELQHQIDGPHLPIAAAVERRLAAHSGEMKERVNRELSAYVAELTAPGAPPKLALIHLVRFALTARGTTEHYVALIALDALRGEDATKATSAADPGAVTDAFLELVALDDGAIRARAASAWRALFGESLPALEELSEGAPAAPQRAATSALEPAPL